MKNILQILYQGNTLNKTQCEQLIYNIINKKLSPIQIASALISMKVRGETPNEIISAAHTLLNNSIFFPKPNTMFADITGTGGDRKNTINISTISALVASTCYNTKIIKHGNYSSSGLFGSMNILKKFNIYTKYDPHQALKIFNKLGICFLCASHYYKILKEIIPIRKELNTPTLFNIIGPLINPSKPSLTLIGVYKKELLSPMIQALKSLHFNRAIVVHCEGIDEVGLHNVTYVSELFHDTINQYTLTPSDFGLNTYSIEELCCNSEKSAYDNMINLLQGKGKFSQISVIAANVALLLKLFGYNDLRSNTSIALETIHQGNPYKKLLSLSSTIISKDK